MIKVTWQLSCSPQKLIGSSGHSPVCTPIESVKLCFFPDSTHRSFWHCCDKLRVCWKDVACRVFANWEGVSETLGWHLCNAFPISSTLPATSFQHNVYLPSCLKDLCVMLRLHTDWCVKVAQTYLSVVELYCVGAMFSQERKLCRIKKTKAIISFKWASWVQFLLECKFSRCSFNNTGEVKVLAMVQFHFPISVFLYAQRNYNALGDKIEGMVLWSCYL